MLRISQVSSTPRANGGAAERGRTILPIAVVLAAVAAVAAVIAYVRITPAGARSVTIRSQPAGATTFVDGVYLGVTPLQTRELASGTHGLKLLRHGFQPARMLFDVDASDETQLDIRLTPEKRYSLFVTATPPGARISLDGIPTGLRTPAELRNLQAGRHELLITVDNYLPSRCEVNVGEKHPGKVEVALRSAIETYYREAIKAEPNVITNYTELAHHYVITNQLERAGQILKQGLDLACRPTADKRQVARLYQEIKKIYYGAFDFGGKEAIHQARPILERILQEVVDRCPTIVAPYPLLAVMYSSTGKPQDAVRVLKKGVENVPDNRPLLFTYARMLYRLGDYDKAVAPLEKLIQRHGQDVAARNMLADIYNRMGKTDLAIEQRAKIADLMKRNPRAATGALVNLAALYHRKHDYAKAAGKWKRAAALQKNPIMKAQFLMSAANEYAQGQDQAKAAALLQEVIRSAPNEDLINQARERLRLLQGQAK
ncbi:MAG: tetratricopeptide repeat protein [Planctomycetes bacterium]|nr:tetratricopeptide repeat protein [Planctomycetota bacterium]